MSEQEQSKQGRLTKRLTKTVVEALGLNERVWDSVVTGFYARRQKGPALTYALLYRTTEGRERWYTIGRHGSPWTVDAARQEAKRLLGAAASGGDPAADKQAKRNAETVAELCDQYLADAEAGKLLTRRKAAKRPSTISSDKSRIEAHIKPLLGAAKVPSVTSRDIEKFMHDVTAGKSAKRQKTGKPRGLHNVRGGQGAASRTVGLLGAIFTYAVKHKMRSDNPVAGVMRPADGKRDRRLSDEEYETFGKTIRQADADSEFLPAVRAMKFLALTGWRASEALELRWDHIDLSRRTAILPMTKSGRSVRPLSLQAMELLKSTPKIGESGLVFPSSHDSVMSGFRSYWDRLLLPQGIPADVTPHTLRHSFASVAADLGMSELSIAILLGHTSQGVTAGYTHFADKVVLDTADKVAASVAERMGFNSPQGQVVQFLGMIA